MPPLPAQSLQSAGRRRRTSAASEVWSSEAGESLDSNSPLGRDRLLDRHNLKRVRLHLQSLGHFRVQGGELGQTLGEGRLAFGFDRLR